MQDEKTYLLSSFLMRGEAHLLLRSGSVIASFGGLSGSIKYFGIVIVFRSESR